MDALSLAEKIQAEAITIDMDGMGCTENHCRALEWLNESQGDWVCVLEDDALITNNFRQQLEMAVAKAPSPIVSLYLGRGRPKGAQHLIAKAIVQNPSSTIDHNWIVSTYMLHAVGYVIRKSLLPELIEWLQEQEPIDEAISDFAQQNHLAISYTRPSLIDHRDDQPVITVRVSRYPDDAQRNEIRKAWMVGERKNWDETFVLMDSL